MKNRYKSLLALFITTCATSLVLGQGNAGNELMNQGIQLDKEHKYAEASEKFSAVLKMDPDNYSANFEMGYALFGAKRGNEAIPYLEKAAKSPDAKIQVAAYNILGSIYDSSRQSPKAIEAYNTAIKINPGYPHLYANLGIAYSRNQQYAEAEKCAIEAIKRDTANAGSQRLYALSAFHQNKRVNALLGFCSFILLEPLNSAEAYGNIQHILQGGALKYEGLSPADAKETAMLNAGIAAIVSSAKAKKLAGQDLLEYELKSIFIMAGQLAEKKTDKSFFDKYYAGYFYKLAQSDNMGPFTRLINLSTNKEENTKWGQANPQRVKALTEWIKNTNRPFN